MCPAFASITARGSGRFGRFAHVDRNPARTPRNHRCTLESLLAQTDPRWEALIVDGGSIDATLLSLTATRCGPALLPSNRMGGCIDGPQCRPFNANGERLLFLDSDDWIDEQFLVKMNAALNENSSAIAACCDHCRVTPDGDQTPRYSNARVAINPFEAFARSCPVAVHSVLVKKSAVLGVGGFDVNLRTCEEWDLWQRVARTGGSWIHVDELLSYYWASEHSLSSDLQQMLADGNVVIDRGFSSDERVKNPAPEHQNGASAAHGRSQAAALAYFTLWCCGINCVRGTGSHPSIEGLADIPQSETAADQILPAGRQSRSVGRHRKVGQSLDAVRRACDRTDQRNRTGLERSGGSPKGSVPI